MSSERSNHTAFTIAPQIGFTRFIEHIKVTKIDASTSEKYCLQKQWLPRLASDCFPVGFELGASTRTDLAQGS